MVLTHLVTIWRIYEGYIEAIWGLYEGYLHGVWKLYRGSIRGVVGRERGETPSTHFFQHISKNELYKLGLGND